MVKPIVRCSVQFRPAQRPPAKPNTTTSPSPSPIDHRTPSCIILLSLFLFLSPLLLSSSSLPFFLFSFFPYPPQSRTPVVHPAIVTRPARRLLQVFPTAFSPDGSRLFPPVRDLPVWFCSCRSCFSTQFALRLSIQSATVSLSSAWSDFELRSSCQSSRVGKVSCRSSLSRVTPRSWQFSF